MMFSNLKRGAIIAGSAFAIIVVDILLRSTIGGIPLDILALILTIPIIALIGSFVYDYYMLRKKQWASYPQLKDRVLQIAEKKKGIVAKGELGKMPPEWYGWLVKRLEADGLAIKDPRDRNQILFPDIMAETHTEDEIMEMNLPMDIGSIILSKTGGKGKKSKE